MYVCVCVCVYVCVPDINIKPTWWEYRNIFIEWIRSYDHHANELCEACPIR